MASVNPRMDYVAPERNEAGGSVASVTLAAQLKEIDEIAAECSVADWDGYDSPALDKKSIEYAKWFLNLLYKTGHTLPSDVEAEPSGLLVLTWENDKYDVSFSINPQGVFEWGGLREDGTGMSGRTEMIDEKTIPDEVERVLKIITSAE